VPKSGHGPSSAVTRSMSAGVFPPTSSRSTRPRTSYAHAGVRGLCGLHEGTVSQRIGPGISATAAGPTGSHRWFPGGLGVLPRESAQSRMGGLTGRGPTVRFACRGPRDLPEPDPALSPSPPWLSPQPLLRPRSTLLSPSSASRSPSPPCFCPSPASERLLPEPALCAQSPPLSWLSSALRACALAGRKRAFACGVPGALRGTWVSSTRFDEMNDPCPRNVLI